MEQSHPDDPTRMEPSSVLTPIGNTFSATPSNTRGKIKRNKRNRRALFHRRKYDINKRRSPIIPTVPISMSYPPNQSQLTTTTITPSTSINQHQQQLEVINPSQPISKGISSSVSEPDSTTTHRYHPNIDFFQLRESLTGIDLAADWKMVDNDAGIYFYKIRTGQMTQPVVARSVTISITMSWHAYAVGKLLTRECCQLLSTFPDKILDATSVTEIIDAVDSAQLCPGNPDPEIVELFERRGHSAADDYCAAYIDVVDVTNSDGVQYARTVRHNKCEILCQQKGRQPYICSACQLYKGSLRVMKWRSQQCDVPSRTSHNSHTNIRYLNVEEMEERLRNVQKQKKSVTNKAKKLEEKMKQDIEENGVALTEPEINVVNDLLKDASDTVYSFPKDSIQYILWEEQKKFNALKDKRQMRWHPLVIRFALSLKYASTAAFQQVTKLGFIALPSERTLRDYTHWCTIKTGVQGPFIDQLKHAVKEEKITGDKKQFCLLMDEMKIKSGLAFSKSSGKLIGFCDLSNVNTEIADLSSRLSGECDQPAKLASHMLVFMVRPVFQPSLCFTIAMYPSSNITGDKLYSIVWEVIESLEMNLLPVISVTSDGASSNRRFYKLCKDGRANHKTRNPFDLNRHIYFFCDAPHLLKTARNCFSNSHSHSKTRKLEVSVS